MALILWQCGCRDVVFSFSIWNQEAFFHIKYNESPMIAYDINKNVMGSISSPILHWSLSSLRLIIFHKFISPSNWPLIYVSSKSNARHLTSNLSVLKLKQTFKLSLNYLMQTKISWTYKSLKESPDERKEQILQ